MQMIGEFKGAYRFLSNFWNATVHYEGTDYKSVEHAFQAAKTLLPSERAWVWSAQTASEAKKRGRQVALRPDWEQVKLDVMEALVRDKFSRHPHLRDQLLATGTHELVEGNWWNDTFWGVCRGTGYNHLGRILMKVRAELSRS
jgi:hypothetical protein